MPLTVTCPACASRFSLGDDLYRRRVAGSVVKVKCRNCAAEIAVDATEPVTMPSHEAPRAHRAPPRPKDKLGPSGTVPVLPSATATPIGRAAMTPLPFNATVTPLPAGALPSIWDTDQTVSINAPKPLPLPRRPMKTLTDEPELIEAEEIPASSSDAPTLDLLTVDLGRPKPPTRANKKAPDDFLVNLSAGTAGILGAPTIDVSGLGAPVPPSVDLVAEEEIEFHPAARTARTGTVPLFDMSAVLPAANIAVKQGSLSHLPARVGAEKAPLSEAAPSEGKARERKFVVAPREAPAAAPKAKRAGAALWFGLVAVAAGIVVVVGLRGRRPATHAVAEPQATVEPAAAPLATTPSANEPAPSAAEAVAETAPAAPSATATNVAVALNTPSAALGTSKPSESVKAEPTEKPKAEAEPTPAVTAAAEEPAKPAVVVHNAPPPADPGTEFDRGAAVTALRAAAAQASACRKDGDPSGTASLTITFAPSGRVTSANIQGPPFAGTPTGGCIANTMRHATVPAFSGEHVTVTKTIVVQ